MTFADILGVAGIVIVWLLVGATLCGLIDWSDK
jgi:hypothetical protein